MKTRIKLSLITVVIAAIFIAFGFLFITTAEPKITYADATYENTDETAFRMLEGSAIKLDEDGFAFRALIDKNTYDNLAGNENIYFIIIPSIYKDAIEDVGYKYYRAVKRYTDSTQDNYGEFNAGASGGTLYVKAGVIDAGEIDVYDNGNPIDCYYLQAGVKGLVEKGYHAQSYFAVAAIEAKAVDENEKPTGFTYTYAQGLDNAAHIYPDNTLYDSVNAVYIKSATNYDSVIENTYYSWYGTVDYPISITSIEEYNSLAGKVNTEEGAIDLSDKVIEMTKNNEYYNYAEDEDAESVISDVYTVTFKDESGNDYKKYTVMSGSKITAPANPEKTADHYSYAFNEWQASGSAFDFDTEITGNTTLTPTYTASINYELSLNSNSATVYYDTTLGEGSFDLNTTHTIVPSISVSDGYNDVTYTYTTSDSGVATVSNGVITSASTKGTATITVTLTDNGTGETLTETVAVKNVRYYELSSATAAQFKNSIEGDTSGYYKLTGDLALGTINAAALISEDFEGVLNGNGHKITYAYGGANDRYLFPKVTATGIIQNVALSVVSTTNDARVRQSAVTKENNGIIDNTFIDISFNYPGQGANVDYSNNGICNTNFGSITNSMIYLTYTGTASVVLSENETKINAICSNNSGKVANVGSIVSTVNDVGTINDFNYEGDKSDTTNYNRYSSIDDMLDGFADFVDDGFNKGTLWTTDEFGNLSFGGNEIFAYTPEISFANQEYIVVKNGSLTVTATATMNLIAVTPVYESSNSNITVSAAGVISTSTVGETTITATYRGVSATCEVIVYTAALGGSMSAQTFNTTINNGGLDGYYILTSNLSLGSYSTTYIFDASHQFGGVINGQGYSMSYYFGQASDRFIFNTITADGVIKNLEITSYVNGTTSSRISRCAAIAGTNNGLIENCYIDMSYSNAGNSNANGLAGIVVTNNGTINRCIVNVHYNDSLSSTSCTDNIYTICVTNTGTYKNIATFTDSNNGTIKTRNSNSGSVSNYYFDTDTALTLSNVSTFISKGFAVNDGSPWKFVENTLKFNETVINLAAS